MSKKNAKMTFGGKFNVVDSIRNCISYDGVTYEGDPVVNEVYITKVYYNNPATIVFWSDGTKTVTKTHGSDIYSPEVGLMVCCFKKLVGASQFKKLLSDWAPMNMDYSKFSTRELADLRREFKQEHK